MFACTSIVVQKFYIGFEFFVWEIVLWYISVTASLICVCLVAS